MDILLKTQHYCAINKPAGLLVHRSSIDRIETQFAVQQLRDHLQQSVYPVHRLDKPTSGVLLFALSSSAARHAQALFQSHQVTKEYIAIVRGFTPSEGCINHPLKPLEDDYDDSRRQKNKTPQSATTRYSTLNTVEIPYAVDKYPTSRYSLLKLTPETGRQHQIRRHLKHIAHPIIGDVRYGKGTHNRFFKAHFGVRRLLLHAHKLTFMSETGEQHTITAPVPDPMQKVLDSFNWSL